MVTRFSGSHPAPASPYPGVLPAHDAPRTFSAMIRPSTPCLTPVVLAAAILASGCGSSSQAPSAASSPAPSPATPPQSAAAQSTPPATPPATPPPAIRAWMDRLTVAHEYDPSTGFIVARETIYLPPLIAQAPPLDAAITAAGSARLVIAFATADRCAPCQQYKRDALNNPAVLARLADARFLPTHVEVDRAPQLADKHLGSRGIPMTYALRDGKVIAVLRGQRSAADLLTWLDALPAAGS